MTHHILCHKAELSSKKTNGNFVLCTETINTRGCRFVRSPSYFPHFNHSHNFCKQPKSQPPCHVSRFNCIRKAPFFNRQFRGRYSTYLLLLLPPPSPLWYACCLINYFLGYPSSNPDGEKNRVMRGNFEAAWKIKIQGLFSLHSFLKLRLTHGEVLHIGLTQSQLV